MLTGSAMNPSGCAIGGAKLTSAIRNVQIALENPVRYQVSGFRGGPGVSCQVLGFRRSEWSHHGSRSAAATAPPNGNSIEPVRVTRSEREYDHPNRADGSSVGSR